MKKINMLDMYLKKIILLTLLTGLFSPVIFATKLTSNACTVPTSKASSQDETAWQLFVAINCKTGGQLTWETWKTQACLNNSNDCNTARLQGSLLRDTLAINDNPRRTQGCSAMTTVATADQSLKAFVPSNLSTQPVFCEEVVINADEEAYATKKGLLTKDGQVSYLQSGATIDFPNNSIEIKADWVPASSFTNVTFDCSTANTTIYKEIIDGTCYALTGIHISSKLYTNWLWATFEPQDIRTNPNRCKPQLYSSCIDHWGSTPPISTGSNTKVTKALTALFSAAGSALDPSFQNYRLTGTQTLYEQPSETTGELGSSFVEFNANVPAHQASCITCHSYAQRQPTPLPSGSTPPGGPLPGGANIGIPTPLPSAYKPLDFSWFLGFGVPNGSNCQDVNAGPIWDNSDAKAKCPSVCSAVSRSWNGQWKTTQPGIMSVCGCCNAD